MPSVRNRFTISVTPEMEDSLRKLRATMFLNCTNSHMLRQLIRLGLQSANSCCDTGDKHAV